MTHDLLSDVLIRPEAREDLDGIRRVNWLAFEGGPEAGMVDALRAADAVTLSMVAVIGAEVVGHVLATPVTVRTDHGEEPLVGLGPVAVLPEQQGRGIGTLLIETTLELLREARHAGVVVLGHPNYYPRFGFIPAGRWSLQWDHEAPDEAFMALELSPGLLTDITGVVRFRPELLAAGPEARGDRSL